MLIFRLRFRPGISIAAILPNNSFHDIDMTSFLFTPANYKLVRPFSCYFVIKLLFW